MNLLITHSGLATALSFVTMLAINVSPVLAEQSVDTPQAVADALNEAIARGEEGQIRHLLDPDVLIFESGGVESSLEEYASHHMGADMEFMAGMTREVLDRDTFESADIAVVTTRARISGTYRENDLNLNSNETLVMGRTESGWKILHVHWSSASAQ